MLIGGLERTSIKSAGKQKRNPNSFSNFSVKRFQGSDTKEAELEQRSRRRSATVFFYFRAIFPQDLVCKFFDRCARFFHMCASFLQVLQLPRELCKQSSRATCHRVKSHVTKKCRKKTIKSDFRTKR